MKAPSDKRPIGVFDSGVGGLSVLIELKKLLPNENFVFLADQFNVPYGEKSKKKLVELVYNISDFFVKKHDIKMMVVACNTATCYTIDELRSRYAFPIVGTVPAVKVAGENTKSKKIGVISTPATSQSQAIKDLINKHCKNIEVINIGCKGLEDSVEQGELDGKEVLVLLNKYLEDIKGSKTDHLVLGCTHYPFLKKPISKILGSKVKLVDGGRGIAKQSKSILRSLGLLNSEKKKGKTVYLTTGDQSKFSKVASNLLGTKVKSGKAKI
jgi:glutamate racemase